MSKRSAVWMRRFLPTIGIVVIVLAGLNACAQSPTTTSNNPNPPITIGTSLSFHGDFKADGAAMAQGYQLWANTINNNGGLLGRPVKLITLDDNSDPAQVVKNYQTLIRTDHVDLVFGPFSTLLTKAAAPIVEQAGYALPEGAGGGPSVFQNGWHNLFDVSLPVASNLVTFALYILSIPASERPKTAAYATEDDPFTQPQVDLARQVLKNGGVTSVYYHVYPGDKPIDYTPIANQIIQSHADVVVMGTLLPDASAFIKRFRQQNYHPKALIATAGPDSGGDFIKAVGGVPATEGVFVPNGWYPQANNFQNAQMVQDYLTQYGGSVTDINADVAEAYSVGQVMAQAVAKINGLDNAKLIAELHSGDAFNTVQGTVQFDSTGQNTSALAYLFQWQHGQFLPVYPSSVAAENPE